MPRPLSWLPRLHEISRSLANSVRSHYDRHELETLFELQPRAAQKLIEMLPSVRVGTSRLLEREVLVSFLDRVQDTDDAGRLFEEIRGEKAVASRRKVRSLVRSDLEPVSLTSLPDTIRLSAGRLEVSFTTVEQLAESLLLLARILEREGEELAATCEIHLKNETDIVALEVDRLFASLEERECGRT
jgi:hypothetical protein